MKLHKFNRETSSPARFVQEKRRTIELRIISAQDLKKPRLLGRMRTYAVAYVDEEHKVRTSVDEKGGQNPVWNDVLTVSVAERQLRRESLACLTVDIFCQGGRIVFARDKLVGTVRIFLADVLKEGPAHNPIHCLAFWIRLPSGEPHGILNVWIPPTGKFLRRQQHSDDFSRMLFFEEFNKPDVKHHLISPARAISLPDHQNVQEAETERFTFD